MSSTYLTHSSCYFDTLPYELLCRILFHLNAVELWRLAQTGPSLGWIARNWDFWADKAKRDFQLPRALFEDTTDTNPCQRYCQVKGIQQLLNWKLRECVFQGKIEWAKYLIDRGATDLIAILGIAIYRQYSDLIRYILAQKSLDLNRALMIASGYGDLDLVKELMSQGATDLRSATLQAALNSQRDVFDYLRSQLDSPGTRIN